MIWAYIDPGIGGLLLQGLIAGLAAMWLFFRKDIPAFSADLSAKRKNSRKKVRPH
jgi:hypothetical protein